MLQCTSILVPYQKFKGQFTQLKIDGLLVHLLRS
jgi:hypothetical protein